MQLRYAKRMDGLSGNAIRDIFKLLTNPEIISFAGGNPAQSALRNEYIAGLAQKVLLNDGKRVLQYGATEGYPPFRESTAAYVACAGVTAAEHEILPVTGSQQGVDLICKAMLDPGDAVLVEEPTFLGALHTMRTYQANIVTVKMDGDGIDPGDLEAKIKRHNPKFIYTIPTFQNPTGRTQPAERRRRVAAIAAEYRVLTLEDDPYRALRYDGGALDAIASYDDSGYVVYMLSYSKTISPGLRAGALVVKNPDLHRKLVICKQAADVHSPNLSQAIVDAYLREGTLDGHMGDAIASYSGQMNKMLSMLNMFPDGVTCVKPQGGLFIWLELPKATDAAAMLPKAAAAGVAYVAGTHFYAGGGHENTMRLNFSNAPQDKIEKGMLILRDVIAKHL